MELSIVIPTLYQDKYYVNLLQNLKELGYWRTNPEVEIITIGNKLVNEAWNEWVAKSHWDYILVLNDDIIIKEWAIERPWKRPKNLTPRNTEVEVN